MPAAEVAVDEVTVRALLAEQVPELADRPLVEAAAGWDNVLWRAGDDLVVRLPRREMASVLVEAEQRWVPLLAPELPLPTPVPLFTGQPGAGYPWRWSVCPWLPGRAAAVTPPADPGAAAEALGTFVAALSRPAPPGAPTNAFRGIPLAGRDDVVRRRIARLHDAGLDLDGSSVLAAWEEALAVPAWAGPPRWLHGDLHPGNVLVHEGRVAAVVDFGDVCAGDPATDLMIGWMLFEPAERQVFREVAGADDATWARARGWAIAIGLAVLGVAPTNPLAGLGERTLAAVLSDPDRRA